MINFKFVTGTPMETSWNRYWSHRGGYPSNNIWFNKTFAGHRSLPQIKSCLFIPQHFKGCHTFKSF
jgi:hypothetical protein